MTDAEHVKRKASELGAAATAVIDVEEIKFVDDFRKGCEANACGHYGKNWMCPPSVGAIDELKSNVARFSTGLLFQTVHQMEDSFDFEGMEQGAIVHEKVLRDLFDYIQSGFTRDAFLPLSVGACRYCDTCGCQTGESCPFPEKAVASLEAHCIDVNNLLSRYGIPYNNGPNTVSYVGLFLFKGAVRQ